MAPLIDLQNVTVVRDGITILHDLSLQIDEGQHTAILGPNGSGKSTLIRVLAHEIYPYAGKGLARIAGKDTWAVQDVRKVLGMVSPDIAEKSVGSPTVYAMAVSGLVGTFAVTSGYCIDPDLRDAATRAMQQMEVEHLRERPFATLSTGEARRVLIARALALRPKGLILDEPSSGLDMKAAAELTAILGRLADSGTTLILITHHLSEVLPAIQQVALLRSGRLVACGRREELMTPQRIADLFDIPLEVAARQMQSCANTEVSH